jgi:hypothetical protein
VSKTIAALLTAVLMLLGGTNACDQKKYDTPAGGDQGDSAGDNQPGSACGIPGAIGEPVAQIESAQFIYDIYVEIWNEDCVSLNLVDEGGAADGHVIPPVHIFVDGEISDDQGHMRKADFLGGSVKEKNVNVPYHLRANVAPRSAPHTVVIVADVNRDARSWVNDAVDDDGFLHCRILRDSAPIVVAKGSLDRVEHTIPLRDGGGQVSCHLKVGVG